MPTPMPALAELLNPEEAEFGVGLSDEVDCFEDKEPVRDTGALNVDNPLSDDSVEVGVVETAALDVVDDEVVLDGTLNPASA